MHFLHKLRAWWERQLVEIAEVAPYPLTDDEWAFVQREQALKEQGNLSEEVEREVEQELRLVRTKTGGLVVKDQRGNQASETYSR